MLDEKGEGFCYGLYAGGVYILFLLNISECLFWAYNLVPKPAPSTAPKTPPAGSSLPELPGFFGSRILGLGFLYYNSSTLQILRGSFVSF